MNKNDFRKLPFRSIASFFSFIIAVVLVISAFIIAKSARYNFEKSSHKELSQLAKNMKLQFELGLNKQLVLANQLSKSPLIIRYFNDPSDEELKKDAFNEVQEYQNSFLSHITFMINEKDLKYYSNNEYLYTLDKNDSSSVWYTSLLNSNKSYVFNINYDIGLKQTFMWVNCIVRDENGDFCGLIGTGISLTDFIDTLYENLDSKSYTMYIFNDSLETTGSTQLSHLEKKMKITEVVKNLNDRESELTTANFIDTKSSVYAFEGLDEIGWHIMVSKDYAVAAFLHEAIFPASICFVVLVFIFLIFFIFIRIHLLHSAERKIGNSILAQIQNLAVSTKENTATAQDQSAAVKEIVTTMEDNNTLSESISEKIKDVSKIASNTSANVAEGVSYLEANVKQLHEIESANLNTIDA